jgi:hypothetical protein
VILAISSRFLSTQSVSVRGGDEHSQQPAPLVSAALYRELAQRAYSSVTHTLLTKRHRLEDIQALIFMSAWGLSRDGFGPDSWVISGHAIRLALRIGLHRVAADLDRSQGQPSTAIQSQQIVRLGTYLALYAYDRMLSLGYGVPATSGLPLPTVKTDVFLQKCYASRQDEEDGQQIDPRTSLQILPGAAAIAAQAELANVTRRLTSLVESLRDNADTAGPSDSIRALINELNAMLDAWCTRWIWPGEFVEWQKVEHIVHCFYLLKQELHGLIALAFR